MRVMLFTDTYAPQVNGVATCVSTLAHSLTEHGHTVMVCTVQSRHTPHHPHTELEEPFPVIRTRAAFAVPLYSDIHIAAPISLAVRRIVRRFQPDIIHCHTPLSIGWQGVQVCAAYHLPLIGTHHTLFGDYVAAYSRLGTEVNTRLAGLVRRYAATFYNQCDVTSTASHFLAHDLVSAGLEYPIKIVPNPVDTQRFRPLSREEQQERTGPRLIYFGRIAAEKNLPRLITLVEPLLRRYPNAVLEIIGDGPVLENIKAFTQKCHLEQQVRFLGWMRGEALARQVARADICVSTSLTENQPISLLESFACGVPVVALAAAGVPEIVRDGENGYLIDPEDTSDQFAQRLEYLIEHPTTLRQLGAGALNTARRYSHNACLEATIAAYQETIEVAKNKRHKHNVHAVFVERSLYKPRREA